MDVASETAEEHQIRAEAGELIKRSTDGGMTWSEPIPITTNVPIRSQGLDFTVPTGPHDRLIQTSSGRVIFPVHFPWFPPDSKPPRVHARQIASAIYYSDNEGRTWTFAAGPLLMRGKTGARIRKRDLEGFWEPAIVETAPAIGWLGVASLRVQKKEEADLHDTIISVR